MSTGDVLEQFLSEVPLGVVVLDRDLKYQWSNPAFSRMSGLASLEGRGLGATYPALGERLAPVLHAVMDSGEPFEWVVQGGATPDAGAGRSWRARYVPVRGSDGSVVGVAALLVDVTHEARLERAQQLLDVLGSELSAIDAPDAIAVAVPDLLVPRFVDGAVIYERDPDGRYRLKAISGDRHWAQLATRDHAALDDLAANVADGFIARGKPLVGETIRFAEWLDDRARELLAMCAKSTPASALFPLAHAEHPVGLLVAFSAAPDFFDPDNVTALTEIARVVAATIHFARLHDTVRAEHRRAEHLQDLGFRCARATTPAEICDAVLTIGGPVVGARTVGVTLVEHHTGELRARSRDIERDECHDYETPLDSRALLVRAMERNELVCAETKDQIDRELAGSAVASAGYVRSACAIPLAVDGRPVGSVGFAFEREGPMTEAQIQAVRLVADQSAAALSRIRLDERRRAAIAHLRDALVPASLPDVGHCELAARYRPASSGIELGGDWYDAFARPDGSVCLIVGDAAGKGVGGAATVGALRHILRYFAYSCDDPAEALTAANDAFLIGADVAPNIATACLAIARPDGSVRLSSAGHLPPLWLGATSARLVEGPVDPPLGVRGHARRSFTAAIAPRDTIVLYTDGLVERRREPMDVSLGRLVDVGPAVRAESQTTDELVERLMQRLAPDATDDVAVLAATCAAPAPRN